MCCPIFLIMGMTLAERKFAIRAAASLPVYTVSITAPWRDLDSIS